MVTIADDFIARRMDYIEEIGVWNTFQFEVVDIYQNGFLVRWTNSRIPTDSIQEEEVEDDDLEDEEPLPLQIVTDNHQEIFDIDRIYVTVEIKV